MKHFLLSLAALAASTSAVNAQNGLTILPNPEDGSLMSTSMSANGRYISGEYFGGAIAFIYDAETKTFSYTPETEMTSFFGVNDNGKGFGYFDDYAIVFDMDGNMTKLNEDTYEDGTFAIAKHGTNDESFYVGNTYGMDYVTHACYWKDGVKVDLPEPTSEWCGFEVNGTSAERITPDGSLIVGRIVDNWAAYPMVLWTRNADGETYSVTYPCKRYFEGGYGSNPYIIFQATATSENGKYVAIQMCDWEENYYLGRYDTETDLLEYTSVTAEPSEGEEVEPERATYNCNAVANDGTMYFYKEVSGWGMQRTGYVWKAGEQTPVTLAEAFPACEAFAEFDLNGVHTPTGVSADGRYVSGFMADENFDFHVYLFDTQAYSAEASVQGVQASKAEAKDIHGLDGVRRSVMERGVNIISTVDGRSFKAIKK